MKYNIRINQYAIVRHKLEIDLIDAAIIDFFESWIHHGNMRKLTENGTNFYWLDYQNLIDEMPMLGIKSKDGVYRRIKKMCEQDIFVPHPQNQVFGRTFFAFGSKMHLLHFDGEGNTPKRYGSNTEGATDETPKGTDETLKRYGSNTEGATDEKSEYNNTSDNNIKNSIRNIQPPPENFSDKWFEEIFDEIHIGNTRATFPEHNVENELKIFKLKVRGSPKDYQHRDAGGIRSAFIYQLQNSKAHGIRIASKESPRGSDAIVKPGKDFGDFTRN